MTIPLALTRIARAQKILRADRSNASSDYLDAALAAAEIEIRVALNAVELARKKIPAEPTGDINMTNRISVGMIQTNINYLNEITNSHPDPYSKDADSKFRANVGNWHISLVSGGCSIRRMVSKWGGSTILMDTGQIPKRECFYMLRAFIAGIEFSKRELEE